MTNYAARHCYCPGRTEMNAHSHTHTHTTPMCMHTMDCALLFGVFNYYIANLYIMQLIHCYSRTMTTHHDTHERGRIANTRAKPHGRLHLLCSCARVLVCTQVFT